MQAENFAELLHHLINQYPKEACGVIQRNRFIPCENVHVDPLSNFRIDPKLWLDLELNGGIDAVVHSHAIDPEPPQSPLGTTIDPRAPSMADMQGIAATGLPWLILYTDGHMISPPLIIDYKNPAPLIGRQYIPNFQDCHFLYRDYMALNHAITIPLYFRPPVWQRAMPTIFEDHIAEDHIPINISEIREGDLLLFRMGHTTINHCGVATSEHTFIHQNYNRVSCEEHLTRYRKFLVKSCRHKQLYH